MSQIDIAKYISDIPPISVSMEMYAVFNRFRANKTFSFFPVVDESLRPVGIIRELELKEYAYGMFGRELIKRENVRTFVKPCPMVEDSTPIDEILLKLGDNAPSDGLVITHEKRYIGVITNLSLLAVYEAHRRHTQRQLSQVQKMEAIGTLAGGIAHDFNNILMPIIGYAEMLKQSLNARDPGLASYTEQILTAANRARELVSQILTFSRQKSKERLPIGLSSIVKEVMKLLRSSLPSTIKIETEIDAVNDVVVSDPTEVHQVLMNLCANAAHAMRAGGGELRVTLKNHTGVAAGWTGGVELQAREYVHLAVCDTGHGIAPTLFARIFEPFFTTKNQGEGTGMGLAVVHGIVRSYGGLISLESEPGAGSTFHVYLPVSKRITEQAYLPAAPLHINGGGLRVLWVDDELMITEIATISLEEMGFSIVTRNSSTEALALFQTTPNAFDVIVTDQTMPELTGLNFAQMALNLRPDIPILLVTGFSDAASVEMAKAIGIRDYVLKPVDFLSIAQRILAIAGRTTDSKTGPRQS